MASNMNSAEVKQGNVKGLMDSPPPQLPVIDLSELDGPQNEEVIDAIVKAAENSGFFQVVNHGLPLELLEELKDSTHCFHNQSEEKKAVYLEEVSPSPLMKFLPGSTQWTVDSLQMTYTDDMDALKYWPQTCKEVGLEYVKASRKLTERILRVLMSNLGVTLDESMADAYLGEMYLVCHYYPTCSDEAFANQVSRKHTDNGTLTVLLQDHVGGLFGKLKEDEWVEIKPIPGALVILIGDCLQILSNGKYKGGEHEAKPSAGREPRVSCPAFTNPRLTTKIHPLPQVVHKDGGKPRYKEFLFGEYKEYLLSLGYGVNQNPIDSLQI